MGWCTAHVGLHRQQEQPGGIHRVLDLHTAAVEMDSALGCTRTPQVAVPGFEGRKGETLWYVAATFAAEFIFASFSNAL